MNIFIRIEGLTGECFEKDHVDWIELASFDWSISGGGRATGRPCIRDLRLTKSWDRTSPELALACAVGRIFPVATLEVTRSQETLTSGNKPVVSYVLRNCLVTSVTPAISGNEISEEVCLSFEEIEWGYRSVLADGSFGELISRRFSFAQNRQLMHIVEEGGVLPAGGPLTPQPPPRLGYHEFVPMTAFIVMWMDPEHPELVDIHNVIRETCDAYGIRAVRADDIQHDDKITDLILEQIRTSEFIVADLTGERPNVYYEIGHAHASGKRPILVRRKGTHLHFDLSTHNVKEYRNATELREILHRRFDGLGLKRNRSEI